MTYLLDTNVISAVRKNDRFSVVMRWYGTTKPSDLYVSALVFGELSKGITILSRRDPVAAQSLRAWSDGLYAHYENRILPVDADVAERWGRMMARRTLPILDGLMAATAAAHNMIFVTRNLRDVADVGVQTLSPWDFA
jgi:toxin FitB